MEKQCNRSTRNDICYCLAIFQKTCKNFPDDTWEKRGDAWPDSTFWQDKRDIIVKLLSAPASLNIHSDDDMLNALIFPCSFSRKGSKT